MWCQANFQGWRMSIFFRSWLPWALLVLVGTSWYLWHWRAVFCRLRHNQNMHHLFPLQPLFVIALLIWTRLWPRHSSEGLCDTSGAMAVFCLKRGPHSDKGADLKTDVKWCVVFKGKSCMVTISRVWKEVSPVSISLGFTPEKGMWNLTVKGILETTGCLTDSFGYGSLSLLLEFFKC